MRKTALAFGLASCIISRIVKRVTTAISTELAGIYIPLPQTGNEVRESAANFYKQPGFPIMYRNLYKLKRAETS